MYRQNGAIHVEIPREQPASVRLAPLIERLTIWPVSIRFCCGPSIRDSALKTSARMSYCTSSDSRPEENRRAKVVM